VKKALSIALEDRDIIELMHILILDAIFLAPCLKYLPLAGNMPLEEKSVNKDANNNLFSAIPWEGFWTGTG